MKRALILGKNKEKFLELAEALTDETCVVQVAEYNDLAFLINGEESFVKVYSTGMDVKEYDIVLVLSTSPAHRENYIFSALSCYLEKHGVKMYDNHFTNTDGKLYAMWRFWSDGINVPKTAFGPADFLAEVLPEFGGKGVLKSVTGTKGKDNYLVHSGAEIIDIVEDNPGVRFILQNFIPNSGDWRIIVLKQEPRLAIYRSSNGKDFRNNTSVGGSAKNVPLDEVSPEILSMAKRAAESLDIVIAGADVIQDDETGEFYVLEVNRTPQLATGKLVDEKAQVLKSLIHSL